MKNIYFTIEGKFWTATFEPIYGKAVSDGACWFITEATNDEVNQTYPVLYLDSLVEIPAPLDPETRDIGEDKVKEILKNYKKELKELVDDKEALKISGIQMKVKMIEGRILEYKLIYEKYYMSNSVKFIKSLIGM